ncbi:variable surface protein Vir7-like protein [Plasmodium vivax North Korean]|uniref:Variable surface protein Vir7-like protein n=1 Tax=Plasmodium vivax North Korean TaxID=1035514 RepID=A0A0J9WEY9_PLAVI|nr:variable surface protein Vir7-like protein [Plasmodium vivax North Korean]
MERILQQDLEKLPSNLIFYKLDKGRDLCSYIPASEEIKDKLRAYAGIENYSDKILKALCYISKMKNNDPFYNERCHFLYYWIGDILSNNLKGVALFSKAMNTIYTELQKLNVEDNCNIIYPDISKLFFDQRKIIYDYSQNYATIKQDFQDYGKSCSQEYYYYVEKIVSTYNIVHDNCENTSDIYCDELKTMFDKYNHQDLSKLKCTLVQHVPKPVAGESDQVQSFGQGSLRGHPLPEQPSNDRALQEETASGFFPTPGEKVLPSADEASPRGSNIFMSSAVPVMGVSFAGFVLHKSRRINNGEQMNVGYHSVQYPSHYSGTHS